MMRYYLAPTIGTGTEQNPYRPKVANYDCSWAAVYEEPEENNSVVAVNARSSVYAQIDADAEVLLLSDNLEEVMTNKEYQRICPDGVVMVYA
jgi:hypothetical protein